jgi:hypothetical protein
MYRYGSIEAKWYYESLHCKDTHTQAQKIVSAGKVIDYIFTQIKWYENAEEKLLAEFRENHQDEQREGRILAELRKWRKHRLSHTEMVVDQRKQLWAGVHEDLLAVPSDCDNNSHSEPLLAPHDAENSFTESEDNADNDRD